MDVLQPERPKSTPPYPYSEFLEYTAKPGHLNLGFSHEEPVFTSNGGTGLNFKNSLSNPNHLIYNTGRPNTAYFENGHVLPGGDERLRSSNNVLSNKRYIHKYATTRIPSSGRTPKWLEGMTSDVTLRPSKTIGHQSGHLYVRAAQKSSPRRLPSYNSGMDSASGSGGIATVGGAGTIFRRSTTERKENCFSFFDIETDKVTSYQYRPGEEVTGLIKIIVRKAVEIRYVELVVLGQGIVTLKKSRESLPPQTVTETYLSKQTYVIGSGTAGWSSVLTPGHYTSKFRVKLPSTLPSTTHHNDVKNGVNVDIDYTLKARICDDAPTKVTHRHGGHQAGLVRVLLGKKVSFNVQRAFDISQIPDATAPVSHREQVYLSCAQTDPAVVSLTLDRAVCQAGDDVRLTLNTSLPSSHRVKDITCELQEHIALDPKHIPVTFTLSRLIRKDPSRVEKVTTGHGQEVPGKITKPGSKYLQRQPQKQQQQQRHKTSEESTFEMTLSTNTALISPHSLSTEGSNLTISYSLNVVLRISPAGGKLSFRVPLDIGPCAEPIYAEKISSRKAVPLFNRPTRFPCFSTPTPTTPSSLSRPPSALSSRSALVTSEYTNSCFARCFLCCMSATNDD